MVLTAQKCVVMYGQKRHPKDVKTQPQEEFITQANHNPLDVSEETPVRPGAAKTAGEGDEPEAGYHEDLRADKRAIKDYPVTKDDEE